MKKILTSLVVITLILLFSLLGFGFLRNNSYQEYFNTDMVSMKYAIQCTDVLEIVRRKSIVCHYFECSSFSTSTYQYDMEKRLFVENESINSSTMMNRERMGFEFLQLYTAKYLHPSFVVFKTDILDGAVIFEDLALFDESKEWISKMCSVPINVLEQATHSFLANAVSGSITSKTEKNLERLIETDVQYFKENDGITQHSYSYGNSIISLYETSDGAPITIYPFIKQGR